VPSVTPPSGGGIRKNRDIAGQIVGTEQEPAGTSLEGARARRRLEALFAAHARAVCAYARRRVGAAEADDVVAETFTVAWRRLDALPERPLPYLIGIARKVIANRSRAGRRRGALMASLISQASAGRSVAEGDPLAAAEARRVLAQLPDGEREALLLVAWDGLSPEDAAVVLGCSRNAVDLRLFRARRRIVALLAEASPAGPEDGVKEGTGPGHDTAEEVRP
jgi:RNA polymerase sigma-70 factor (ECF subfamily)